MTTVCPDEDSYQNWDVGFKLDSGVCDLIGRNHSNHKSQISVHFFYLFIVQAPSVRTNPDIRKRVLPIAKEKKSATNWFTSQPARVSRLKSGAIVQQSAHSSLCKTYFHLHFAECLRWPAEAFWRVGDSLNDAHQLLATNEHEINDFRL